MAEHFEPDRLDVVLASVGQHLVVEPAADGRSEAARPGPWGRRLLAAAVVLAVASAAVASIPSARRAVSGWLRAGNIDVEIDPDLTVGTDLPAFVDDVAPLDDGQLADRLGQP